MLKILGKVTSINVRKVLWTCEELGLTYDREDWGSGFQDTTRPEFLALNPNGLVPVLLDGDTVLWESNTIIRYLASKHEARELLPIGPLARARVEQWMDWQATDFNSSWSYAFQALVRKNPTFNDQDEIQSSLARWGHHVRILDAQLEETGAYVAGSDFTLADVPIGLSVNRWFETPVPQRPEFRAVSGYFDRLSMRAPFTRHGRNGVP